MGVEKEVRLSMASWRIQYGGCLHTCFSLDLLVWSDFPFFFLSVVRVVAGLVGLGFQFLLMCFLFLLDSQGYTLDPLLLVC